MCVVIPRKPQFKYKKLQSHVEATEIPRQVPFQQHNFSQVSRPSLLSDVALVVGDLFNLKTCKVAACESSRRKQSKLCRFHDGTLTGPCETSNIAQPHVQGFIVSKLKELDSWKAYLRRPSRKNLSNFLVESGISVSSLQLSFQNTVNDAMASDGSASVSRIIDMLLCPIIGKYVLKRLDISWTWSSDLKVFVDKLLNTEGEQHTKYMVCFNRKNLNNSRKYADALWCIRFIADAVKGSNALQYLDTLKDWLKLEGTSDHDDRKVICVLGSMAYQVNYFARQIMAHGCATSISPTSEFLSTEFRRKLPLFIAVKYAQVHFMTSLVMRVGLFPCLKTLSLEPLSNLVSPSSEEFVKLLHLPKSSTQQKVAVETYVAMMFSHMTYTVRGAAQSCELFLPLIFWDKELLLLPFFYLAFIGYVKKCVLSPLNKGGPFELLLLRATKKTKKQKDLVMVRKRDEDSDDLQKVHPDTILPFFGLNDKTFIVDSTIVSDCFFASDGRRKEILALPTLDMPRAGVFVLDAKVGLLDLSFYRWSMDQRYAFMANNCAAIVAELRCNIGAGRTVKENLIAPLNELLEILVASAGKNGDDEDKTVVDTACVYTDKFLSVGCRRREDGCIVGSIVVCNQESRAVEANDSNEVEATDDDEEDDDGTDLIINNTKFPPGKLKWSEQKRNVVESTDDNEASDDDDEDEDDDDIYRAAAFNAKFFQGKSITSIDDNDFSSGMEKLLQPGDAEASGIAENKQHPDVMEDCNPTETLEEASMLSLSLMDDEYLEEFFYNDSDIFSLGEEL